MNLLSLVVTVIVLVCVLIGIVNRPVKSGSIHPNVYGGVVYSWTDTDTGCRYLIVADGHAITPRIGPGGDHWCPR
jgi:hypothetical protein